MLTKRISSVFVKHFPKCLSTAPLPKIENDVAAETENPEENILRHPDYFKVHNLFTVKDLFKARVHYGHKDTTLHHNMKPFVFGTRLGHVIFDLDITASFLREALNFVAHMAYRDGIILFVSKNPSLTLLVENTANKCKEFALTREFPFGLFTDSFKKFGTHIRLPDLIIALNTLEENGFQHQMVVEAAKMCIPMVGIVDSNCNPNLITYPVPGNDDSYSSVELYCNLFQKAILRGKREREKNNKKNLESATKGKTDVLGSTANEQSKGDASGSAANEHSRLDVSGSAANEHSKLDVSGSSAKEHSNLDVSGSVANEHNKEDVSKGAAKKYSKRNMQRNAVNEHSKPNMAESVVRNETDMSSKDGDSSITGDTKVQ